MLKEVVHNKTQLQAPQHSTPCHNTAQSSAYVDQHTKILHDACNTLEMLPSQTPPPCTRYCPHGTVVK